MSRDRRQFLRDLACSSVAATTLPPWLASAAGTGNEQKGPGRAAWPPPAEAEDFWGFVRKQYPLNDERTYLNTAGLGPAPYPVLEAAQRTTSQLQAVSKTGRTLFKEAHSSVARFLGASPEEIAFTRNATEANSIIAAGLKMNRGDEVIFESHAHPGGALPWLSRKKTDDIRVKIFDPDPESAEANVERIEDLITPRTRAIQVSHVTAPTGIRFPVRAIARLAHRNDLWFHIDGAQTAGMFPVDLQATECDSYATSGHKWMGAPHGTGLLYVKKERTDRVDAVHAGSYSAAQHYALPDPFKYYPAARRYEYGTRSASDAVGLAASAEFLQQIGMSRVEKRGRELAEHLRRRLQGIDGVTILTPSAPSLSASILTFRTEDLSNTELYRFFVRKRSLRCRIVNEQNLNAIRVAPHVFNTVEECDRVAEATRTALAGTG